MFTARIASALSQEAQSSDQKRVNADTRSTRHKVRHSAEMLVCNVQHQMFSHFTFTHPANHPADPPEHL
eukprot:3161112-Prymnesium_polylepis.1